MTGKQLRDADFQAPAAVRDGHVALADARLLHRTVASSTFMPRMTLRPRHRRRYRKLDEIA